MKKPNPLRPHPKTEASRGRHVRFRPGKARATGRHFTVALVLVTFGVFANAQGTAGEMPASRLEAQTAQATSGIELRSLSWRLHPTQPALSTLTARTPQAEFQVTAGSINSFAVKLAVELRKFEGQKTILEIPEVAFVRLRQHDPRDRNRQNYPAFKMPDDSVPVLEATVVLHSVEHPDWTNMTIGIPLAMLPEPEGKHEIILHFGGVNWTMFVDGELLDNNFPFGYPQWSEKSRWKVDAEYVKEAALYLPGVQPEKKPAKAPQTAPGIQYWLPAGHNNWVGNVETCFFQGRYHVFYLYDRRHHQSKFGCGAHYFEHLSTADFRTWTEHEAATPLEQQWECIGTGVPFEFRKQLCLSYGWHTTRVYPEEKTTLPAQRAYLKQNGRTGAFKAGVAPGVPAGATYSVSADGVANFKKSYTLFHPCENPSVYTDPSGQLRLLANYRARGMWESESVDSGWRCVNPDFPPGGDCTILLPVGPVRLHHGWLHRALVKTRQRAGFSVSGYGPPGARLL